MNNNEFLGMLVIALISLLSLIGVFVKLSWNMSKTLTEISTTLKAVVKMADEHEKDIKDLKDAVHKNTSVIDLINLKCNFAHRIDD